MTTDKNFAAMMGHTVEKAGLVDKDPDMGKAMRELEIPRATARLHDTVERLSKAAEAVIQRLRPVISVNTNPAETCEKEAEQNPGTPLGELIMDYERKVRYVCEALEETAERIEL